MYKRTLAVTSLLLVTLSLSAIDFNEATTIIEEASKATENLQNKFDALSEDNATTQKIAIVEEKITKVEEITPQEIIEVIEVNETVKKNVVLTDKNVTLKETPTPVQVPMSLPTVEESQIKPTEIIKREENNNTKIESNVIPLKEIVETEEISPPILSNELNESQIPPEEIELIETVQATEKDAVEEEAEDEEGSVMKGLVIFKTRLKGPCGMTGEEFSKNYSQEDWDDIYDSKEFKKVVIQICPKMEGRYQERWTKDLYQFSLKYASDSDEIPEC